MVEYTLSRPILRLVAAEFSTKVRLTDDARKCVVLLGHCALTHEPESFQACATGFLVADGATRSLYVVTAAHCVRRSGLVDPFHIRINTPDHAIALHVPEPDWVFHEDQSVDVAAIQIPIPAGADMVPLSMNNRMFLTDQRLGVGDFGPGDQTYTVGLFSFLSGKSRNIPLVHVGHIAAFPDEHEKIEVMDWRAPPGSDTSMMIDAYVVQCAAMPGASGSPVFVRKPVVAADELHRHHDDGSVKQDKRKPPMGYGAVFLLGLWRGSWDLDKKRMVAGAEVRDPAGYGIVVPAQKILEVLKMPKLQKAREAAANKTAARNFPTDDALPASAVQKRFDSTLKKMLDTPPSPKAGKKG